MPRRGGNVNPVLNLDWDDAVRAMDERSRELVTCMAGGVSGRDIAKALRVSPPRVCQLKRGYLATLNPPAASVIWTGKTGSYPQILRKPHEKYRRPH